MTSLSTLFGGGQTSGADPLQEGLPCVAVYGGDFNTYFDMRVHRVHSGELVGAPWGAVTNSTANYYHGMTNYQMFGYNSDYGNLQGQFSSEGYGSHQNFTQSLFQNDHYPYAFFGNVSPEGRMGFHSFHGNDYYQKYYRRINVISLKGRRPRRQFNLDNQQFSETEFNSYRGLKSEVTLSTDYLTPLNIEPGSYTSYGSACYNQNTKTLAIYYADSTGSASGRIYMFRSTVDLMDEATCPTVATFFDNSAINYIKTQNVTNWGYSSMNYNVNMMLGDNDMVIINTRYDNNDRLAIVDCSSTTNVTSAQTPPQSDRSQGQTTSYGPEQGMMYRARMQMSWDGEWAAMYSPYYYYGGGLSCWFVSVKNPRKMAYVNLTQSSGGGALLPSGRSGFKWLWGQNTDGQPINNWGIDLRGTGHDHTTAFEYAPTNYGYGNAMTSVANWTGNLGTSVSSYTFQYPGYYYSTSYPRFMSVNWWPQQGTYQS